MRALLLALAACSSAATSHAPTTATKPAVLGETLTLSSRVLGEQRTINVYLPPGYATDDKARYPVLYMLDGGMAEDFPHVVGSVDVSIKNAIIEPVIVVGVENTERRRDLVGPTTIAEEQKAAPHAGGATKFRAFLREELKPLIAARYRTSDRSALIGESLAGLFVVETFVTEPALFDGYIAADPSVWWNEQAVVRGAAPQLAACCARPTTLYIASAPGSLQEAVDELTTLLRIYAPANLVWRHEVMPDANHGTIFPTAALHGIRMTFAR